MIRFRPQRQGRNYEKLVFSYNTNSPIFYDYLSKCGGGEKYAINIPKF
jgi:hypothetical protein